MIPEFLENGYLPEGIYDASIEEVAERFVFSGKRRQLLNGLMELIAVCISSKINIIYLDGSFISKKLRPVDYDACYDTDHPDRLSILKDVNSTALESDSEIQKQSFGGEIHYANANMAHIKGSPTILEWFQTCKEDETLKKGIIRIILKRYDNE